MGNTRKFTAWAANATTKYLNKKTAILSLVYFSVFNYKSIQSLAMKMDMVYLRMELKYLTPHVSYTLKLLDIITWR